MKAQITKILGFKRFHFDVIDSTNLEAKRTSNINESIIITCDVQTSGRGRNGKDWISEDGNLFLSFKMNPRKDIKPEIYSYITANSICDVLSGYGLKPEIKWPNDVLVDGKKISGILLEKQDEFLIIGVGINITSSPKYLDNLEATSLKELNLNKDKEDVIIDLLKSFRENNKQSFSEIISEVDKRLNKEKFYKTSKGFEGKVRSISDNGNLIIESEEGLIEVSYGEIFEL